MIDEHKSQILSDLIGQIEDNIGDLSVELENNRAINDTEWQQYEKHINDLYSIIHLIKEEII